MRNLIIVQRLVLAAVIALVAVEGLSAEVVWSGGAGVEADGSYHWTNRLNWVGGAIPANGDIVVFRNVGDLTVRHPNSGDFRALRFEGGNVTLTAANKTGWGFGVSNAASNELYVASGSTVSHDGIVISKNLSHSLYKTGGGTFMYRQIGGDASGNYFRSVVVAEGTLQGQTTESVDALRMCALKLIVGSGATFYARTCKFITTMEIVMEEGSKLHLRGWATRNSIGGLSGCGEVFDTSSSYSPLFITVPEGADQVFSGTFNDKIQPQIAKASKARWVLGATNVFENAGTTTASQWLSFLPGVKGPFVFGADYRCNSGGFPLHLADTDGNPVAVIARIDGSANTFCVDGPGDFYIKAGTTTLTNRQVQLTGVFGVKGGTTTLGDGTAFGSFDFSTISGLDVAGGTLKINNSGATTCGAKVTGGGTLDVRSPMTFGNFRKTSGATTLSADMTMADGEANLGNFTFSADGVALRQLGGTLVADSAPTIGGSASSANLILDGGTVRIPFTTAAPKAPFNTASGTLSVSAGEGGATLHALTYLDGGVEIHYGLNVLVSRAIASAAGGVDGGIIHRGAPFFSYSARPSISGPFAVDGTAVHVASGASLSGDGGFFGSGDFVLRNGQLAIDARAASGTLTLGGTGKALKVGGGSLVFLRKSSGDPAQSVEVPSMTFEPGGMLVLRDDVAKVGADGASSVKVTEGSVPVSSASGRVLANVFGLKNLEIGFLGYDSSRGFVPLSGVLSQSTFSGSTSGTVLRFVQNAGAWYETPASASYAAEAMAIADQMTVKLGANTTLTIGDGVNTGVLAMEKTAQLQAAAGAGVSFGAAEGLVVVGGYTSGESSRSTLSAPILAGAGLSIMGVADNSVFRAVNLSGANAYSGVTRVGSACVYAQNAACFSSGDVYVIGGERHGGQVRFDVEGGTWANGFHVAGTGIRHSEYNGRMGNGALSFKKNGTVSGAVELTAPARIATWSADVTGTLSGVVSGDRLDVAQSPGVIVLSGANTYTGGTYIVRATLALARGDSAGTGPVVLEDGTLVFENAEAATFTNALSGVGTVALKGTAPVAFHCDVSGLDAALDLAGTRQTFDELPPFDSITNSQTAKATIALSGGLGTVDWGDRTIGGKISLAVGEGSLLDLGGRTVDVYRIEPGSEGRIVNGTVNESNPAAGLILICK